MDRQRAMRRVPIRPGQGQAPPPIPAARPMAAIVAKPAVSAREVVSAAPAMAVKPRSISAADIRKLMLSRRTAMRTIYVLSEVVGPPLGLRD